jgi:serine/threonine protein phosphatase PrpC
LTLNTQILRVNAGFSTKTGRRTDNQDYVGLCCGAEWARNALGQVAAIADGVGGNQGGRAAAELVVRGFIDGYFSASATNGVARDAATTIGAINRWLYAVNRTDSTLKNAATTFTALVLQGRSAHVLHVGDSRVYLLHDTQLSQLTTDHTLPHPDLNHVLSRAVGFEQGVRLDHRLHPLRVHDRLMLCTDGIHSSLNDREIAQLLLRRRVPTEDAEHIVAAALAAGSQDNASCIIIDILQLPEAEAPELQSHFASLPIKPPPAIDQSLDGFTITGLLAQGRYSRLLHAVDTSNGTEVVLKFPQPHVASATTYHLAFVREAWVAARLHSPYIGATIELPVDRQTQLYSAMPYYEGETLEKRLLRDPPLALIEGVALALKLAKAIAVLHRAGIIHRDIKPDNVLLERDGGLRLIDLGVVRLPRMADFPAGDVPGTPSYMAPELFAGQAGDEFSDQFALGVTLYRAFTGRYPYGEIEPFTRPRFAQPGALSRHRPDLPAWLEHVISRTIDPDPALRFSDTLELALELESSMAQGEQRSFSRVSLYERNPLRFWQSIAIVLALALVASLAHQILSSH